MFTLVASMAMYVAILLGGGTASTNSEPDVKDFGKAAISQSLQKSDAARPMDPDHLISTLDGLLADLKTQSAANQARIRAVTQVLQEARDRQFLAHRQAGAR